MLAAEQVNVRRLSPGVWAGGLGVLVLLASITAHEMFHSWNVKRLRPVEMVPYRYDAPEPTTLLWVSEGITDYYADLALLRGGIIDSTVFLNLTDGKRQHTYDVPPIALEDASLSTWIHPTDGTDQPVLRPAKGTVIDRSVRANNRMETMRIDTVAELHDPIGRDAYTIT